MLLLARLNTRNK